MLGGKRAQIRQDKRMLLIVRSRVLQVGIRALQDYQCSAGYISSVLEVPPWLTLESIAVQESSAFGLALVTAGCVCSRYLCLHTPPLIRHHPLLSIIFLSAGDLAGFVFEERLRRCDFCGTRKSSILATPFP
jgi:hypothetical protein